MKTNSKFLKKLDIFLLVLFPIISVILSLAIKANFFTSILLFYGPPSLWLSFRTPNQVPKTLIFTTLCSIPFGIVIDYLATTDQSWFVPVSIFPSRLFGIIPYEDIIWGFLLVYSTIIFYEHFLDKGKQGLVDRKMKYFVWPVLTALIVFLSIHFLKPELLVLKYAYLLLGIGLVLIPSITFLSFFPRLISKYIKTASYFFILSLLFELTALQLNQWTFPGNNFIGWVSILGFDIPFEEFFFFFVMTSIGILSYYEFFDDDRK